MGKEGTTWIRKATDDNGRHWWRATSCSGWTKPRRKTKELCSHSVVKLHEATQMFMMVDYVSKMSVKKSCKYGEYGSFEHLLFLWCCCCFVLLLFCSKERTPFQCFHEKRLNLWLLFRYFELFFLNFPVLVTLWIPLDSTVWYHLE